MNGIQTIITTTLFLPLLFGCGGGEMNTQDLAVSGVLTVNRVMARFDGIWNDMDGGLVDGQAERIIYDPVTEYVYYVGTISLNGTDYYDTARYDKVNGWSVALGDSGVDLGIDLIVHPTGDLYVVGFTTGKSTTDKFIKRWDGTTWTDLGTGEFAGIVSPALYTIAVDPDTGLIYVGGNVTKINGVAVKNVAVWDGSSWGTVGSGLNGMVRDLQVYDGWLYAFGAFDKSGDESVTGMGGIAKFEIGVSTEWEAGTTGGGCPGIVNRGLFLPNGTAVIIGAFDTADGQTAEDIAILNGNRLSPLGSGKSTGGTGDITNLAYDKKTGRIYLCGYFDELDGLELTNLIGYWGGSSYAPLDLDLPGASTAVKAVMVTDVGDLYLSFETSGDAQVNQINTVNNAGSADAYPKFIISRSGGTSARLESIINYTTGRQLLFNWPLPNGDEIVIDLTPGRKQITSRLFGNAFNKLLNTSDFGSFCLIPGVNEIGVYVSTVGSPTLTAFIQWETEYSSLDGAAS